MWESVSEAANQLQTITYDKSNVQKHPHNLPAHPAKLKQKWEQYQREGLGCLVHRSFGNANARKVTGGVERLLLSIFVMENKPYGATAWNYLNNPKNKKYQNMRRFFVAGEC